jgi:hypothetical protein
MPIVRTELPDMGCRLGRVHGRLISAGVTGDLLDPVSDDVTHHLVRQRRRGSEPDRSLGQLEGRQPVAHRVHDAGTEREDAQMLPGARKASNGFWLYLSAAIP